MNNDKLKPCPFCGGRAEVRDIPPAIPHENIRAIYFVQCTKCGQSTIKHAVREYVIRQWNKRVKAGSVSLIDGHID